MQVLDWLESLPSSEWVATSEAGYPALLSIHSIGMAAVVGLLFMLDLRVLGFARGIPLGFFQRLMPFAWAGFGLNLVSGVLLFNSTAHRLSENWAFLAKIGCILAAGAVTWLLWRGLKGHGLEADVSGAAKGLAALSIMLWAVAITFGRLIAYVMDHQILNGVS